MNYRARVYLQRPSEMAATYIGPMDVDSRPVKGHQVRFTHDGKIEIGLVDQVVPDSWESLGVVPTIHVVQRAG
jgi:hypothetical protein